MFKRILLTALTLITGTTSVAGEAAFKIYLDADRTGYLESARSIEMGFKVAFDEVDNKLGDTRVEFITLDHRGNVKRSRKNMEIFKNDPQGLVYVGGLHSPPLIKYRDYINDSQILTLVPWAAGAPITRHPVAENNYIFRLSVDDSKVGPVLVEQALEAQCQNSHLLLENTGWGKSNDKAMRQALPASLKESVKTTWFNWGINDNDARLLIRDLEKQKVDCILLVSNAREGKFLIEAISDVNADLQVFSHWGITGGDFPQQVLLETREKAHLKFIQSCFNFYSRPLNEQQREVLEHAQTLFPQEVQGTQIKAPAGFVHGYDLAKVFIAATQQVTLTNNKNENSQNLKLALESLQAPVEGLIKTYKTPFSVFSQQNLDAHEALGSKDLCMARFDERDSIKLEPQLANELTGRP